MGAAKGKKKPTTDTGIFSPRGEVAHAGSLRLLDGAASQSRSSVRTRPEFAKI
jgi:hypothetical protein